MTDRRFSKVLVANRGEIAVRVLRGARRLGYRTVAVYSDADAGALHVLEADEAVRIGPAPAKDSYLLIDAILAAAKQSGAEAIHPGYGFLSERADFAQAVQEAGLIFIGPDPASIEAMGNKSASKIRMLAAGVPCVPGYQGEDQRDATLIAEAGKIGLPVMVKAAAGGGGRGMRLVHDDGELAVAIASARSEASNAFGSGQLLIEKAVIDARHVEIQVFGDRHAQVVHFGERDCSVQRRNQKLIEEAPSPAVDAALRLRMGAAAVAAARAVNYVGAGTVEFLLGKDGQFYFLEMNTRLQVEHPVTELVYGVDLVEWQLRVAQGEALPLTQEQILSRKHGWAIEVRLCAEDPRRSYLPQTGQILCWREPAGAGVRVDSYLRQGQQIGAFYDSMQAKIIAWGEDREIARTRLLSALRDTTLLGVVHNRDHLAAMLAHEDFASGQFSTDFVGRHFPQTRIADEQPSLRHLALAVVALYLDAAATLAETRQLVPELIGWRSSHDTPGEYRLKYGEHEYRLAVLVSGGRQFVIDAAEQRVEIVVTHSAAGEFRYRCDGVQYQARCARDGDLIWIDADGRAGVYRDVTLAPAEAAVAGSDGRLLAHSDGKIVAVHVQAGDIVGKGQTLIVLEAMKMEFQLALPVGGTVETIGVQPGQQVKSRQLLAHLRLAG
ncbi:biotin carboxylase N-terminal domain-containing protein [Solimonas terrae]|uniref:Biotin carboxylase n=1 Tax=Solimonas terrae TaxID=1396819 RepID=A0A6M2BL33_9GAMM|nr:biotin carboxylase N-terminal domain-containing protein [Solimonas terrae]NGY03472.1 ATP-grasp domain-containing protein [Solimonas terrae]